MMYAQNYIILSEKEWNSNLVENLKIEFPRDKWIHINHEEEFNFQVLSELKPKKIFIPHWSHIIPKEIFENFECIVFHMTDLPYGRGGSPLQNLIVRGHKDTMISALKVVEEIDAGPIYLKSELSLEGNAQEIFNRCNDIIQKMISQIVKENPIPSAQVGEIIHFKRRKREDGDIGNLDSLESVYDYIRMLDAEGYPKAFLELDHFTVEFSDVKYENNKALKANVRIIKK